jgi:hypothetical protein
LCPAPRCSFLDSLLDCNVVELFSHWIQMALSDATKSVCQINNEVSHDIYWQHLLSVQHLWHWGPVVNTLASYSGRQGL